MNTVWSNVLSMLEWLSRYGFIDIIFGIGITTLVWRAIKRYLPRNLPGLHVDTRLEPPHRVARVEVEGVPTYALFIIFTNTAAAKVYVTKAYFRAYYRRFLFWKWKTELTILPIASKDIHRKEYELKFARPYQSVPDSSSSIDFIRELMVRREMDTPESGFVRTNYPESKPESSSVPVSEFDVLISPYNKTFTFLPLLEQSNQAVLDSRRCGKVFLQYLTSDGKSGKHVRRI